MDWTGLEEQLLLAIETEMVRSLCNLTLRDLGAVGVASAV